jgi:hypothetical protein
MSPLNYWQRGNRFRQVHQVTRKKKFKLHIHQIVRDMVGASEGASREYVRGVAELKRQYSNLGYAVGRLFEPDDNYAVRLNLASEQLDRFEKQIKDFTSDPTVRAIFRETAPPHARIPFFSFVHHYIRRSHRSAMAERYRELINQRLLSKYGGQVKNYNASQIVNTFESAEWAVRQKELFFPLRKLFRQLEYISREGGSDVARLYIESVALFLPRHRQISPNNLPLFFLDTLSSVPNFILNIAGLAMPSYVTLGKIGAARLYGILHEEDRSFQMYPMQRAINLTKPLKMQQEGQFLLSSGINLDTVATLVETLQIGRRNYGFSVLVKNPAYVTAFESLRAHLDARTYMSFLLDYGGITIAVNVQQTPMVDVVNEAVKKNMSGAVQLVRDPTLLTDGNLDGFLQAPQTADSKKDVVKSREKVESKPTPAYARRERVSWFDMMFPEYHPLRYLVEPAYQQLVGLGGEHRLKDVPIGKLEVFCEEIQELPTPVLVHLIRDNDLFDAYLQKLEDQTLLQKLQEPPKEGNLYRHLRQALHPPEHPVVSAAKRVADIEGNEQEYLSNSGSGYRRIVVWGELTSEQQQRISSAIGDEANIVFVDASAKNFPHADAAFFVKPRGGHLNYSRAYTFYRNDGTDIYNQRRHVGSTSLIAGIRNIQRAKSLVA